MGKNIIKSMVLIVKKIKTNNILHLEVLRFLISIQVLQLCIPPNLHYFLFGRNDDIEVIDPFDFVLFTQQFWKNWSRPVGEMLR